MWCVWIKQAQKGGGVPQESRHRQKYCNHRPKLHMTRMNIVIRIIISTLQQHQRALNLYKYEFKDTQRSERGIMFQNLFSKETFHNMYTSVQQTGTATHQRLRSPFVIEEPCLRYTTWLGGPLSVLLYFCHTWIVALNSIPASQICVNDCEAMPSDRLLVGISKCGARLTGNRKRTWTEWQSNVREQSIHVNEAPGHCRKWAATFGCSVHGNRISTLPSGCKSANNRWMHLTDLLSHLFNRVRTAITIEPNHDEFGISGSQFVL